MDLESQIGEWGRFQATSFVICCFVSLTGSLSIMSTVFTTTPPKHRCFIPGVDIKSNSSDQQFDSNFSATPSYQLWFSSNKAQRAKYFPVSENKLSISVSLCNYCPDKLENQADTKNYGDETSQISKEISLSANFSDYNDTLLNLLNNGTLINPDNDTDLTCVLDRTVTCDHGIIYDRSQFYSTLAEYFNMVCDSTAWKKQLSSSMYMVGLLIGSLVMGFASDRYGRKPTMLVGATFFVVSGFSVALVDNYVIYCILQVLIGIGGMGQTIGSYCLVLEIIGKNKRSAIGIWYQGVYSFGCLYVGGIGYLVRKWRLVVVLSMAPTLLILPLSLFLPCSVLWLERNGRFSEALAIIQRIRRFNGMTESQEFNTNAEDKQLSLLGVAKLTESLTNEAINKAQMEVETNSCSSGYATVALENDEVQNSPASSGETASCCDQVSMIQEDNQQPPTSKTIENTLEGINEEINPVKENETTGKELLANEASVLAATDTISDLVKSEKMKSFNKQNDQHNDIEFVQPTQNSFRKLLSHHIMARHILIIGAGFTAASMTFYGISLNMNLLPGNLYLNYTISNLLEFPGQLITVWLLNRAGRRRTLAFLFIFGGSCNVVSACVPSAQKAILILLAILAKVAASGAFNGIWTYAVEVFPTEARSSGIGVASFMSRIGSMVAPQIALLAVYSANWVPFVIFGTITVFAGLSLAVWAPKTKDRPLPQTVEDSVGLDDYGKSD